MVIYLLGARASPPPPEASETQDTIKLVSIIIK